MFRLEGLSMSGPRPRSKEAKTLDISYRKCDRKNFTEKKNIIFPDEIAHSPLQCIGSSSSIGKANFI